MNVKKMPLCDIGAQRHILENVISEKYQRMTQCEREQVREAIVHRSSDVHEFAQNFLDSVEEH
ncbi:hypothetical protein [Secundilactobacillus similis]|uniref:hypothetical protein n=1 Tax=Secundilactobacillus similis TaxID=414682 RepID=UPI0006D118A6|nr:hypothetical protein [Secundilactobacillus similis]